MTAIRVEKLSFAFGDVRLFHELSLHLSLGWTALVGPNGCGKSTLLRLIAGGLRPQSGRVVLEPAGASLRLCPQEVEPLGPEIEAFAWAWEPEAARWRATLGLDPEVLPRWATLSPGERKRWQIGTALAENPEILLLDEPSNHLDAQARARLVLALRRFDGVGVLVSHDRELLQALCAHTALIEPGGLRLFPGAYEEAKAQREAEQEALQGQHEQRKRQLAAETRRLHEAERRRGAAERQISAAARSKGPKDHDGRSMGARTLAAWGEAAHARALHRQHTRVQRAERELSTVHIEPELGMSLVFRGERAPRHTLLELDPARILVAGRALQGAPLSLGREDRICLSGPNGAGKSTVLRALKERSTLPPERCLWLEQEMSAEAALGLLQRCRALPGPERGRLMQSVAALGASPERLLVSACPSPGEARKLAIAEALARSAWLLVLDEPNNHLDLPSIERLEQALLHYSGALLLVTHDEAMAQRLTTRRWHVEAGVLWEQTRVSPVESERRAQARAGS